MKWLKAFIVYIGIPIFIASCILGSMACVFSLATWMAKTLFNDPALDVPIVFAIFVFCIGGIAAWFNRQSGSEEFDRIVLRWKHKLSKSHFKQN